MCGASDSGYFVSSVFILYSSPSPFCMQCEVLALAFLFIKNLASFHYAENENINIA